MADEWVQGAAYVRVSKEREEMISPVLQRASVDDHAERAHIRLAETIEDLDRTGRNFARAGIQRILTGVEDGRWQTVLVYRYDRFGRNVRDGLVNIARRFAAAQQVDVAAVRAALGGTLPLDPAAVAEAVAAYAADADDEQPGLRLAGRVDRADRGLAVVEARRSVTLPFVGWLGVAQVQVAAVARARSPVLP